MNGRLANLFVTPMGIGSGILLYLSAYSDDSTFSLFTDNETYYKEIALLLLFSFAYFIIDLICMIIYYNPKDKVYFLHHGIGIVAIPIIYFEYYYLVKFLLSYLTYELSTPFLNEAKINHHKGIDNLYSKTITYLFVITYTIIRICFGTFLLFKTIHLMIPVEYPTKCLIILPILLQLLNYKWFTKIISMLKTGPKKSKTN